MVFDAVRVGTFEMHYLPILTSTSDISKRER